ncbi:MAG TPA: peptidase E [Phycisphaerae bacterium]|nr:peptidase E [Phycisphaerae bacterium]
MKRQIVVLGGGGFSAQPDNRLLDDYALRLTRKQAPRVCFVATAGGDNPDYVKRFYAAFRWPRAKASHLPLFARDSATPREQLLAQDLIYVGGGNTANLLAVWRLHGVDQIMREAWQRGIVLAGVCAGMLCWFEGGVTDSFGPLAAVRNGLGILSGSACPYYDADPLRRPTYHRKIRDGLPGGYAADVDAALHFVGTRLKACLSSRRGARAYRVELRAGAVRETALPTRLLGARQKTKHTRQRRNTNDGDKS